MRPASDTARRDVSPLLEVAPAAVAVWSSQKGQLNAANLR